MNFNRSALLAGAALLFASQSLADDSSAALGMGGVVLTQTADIRMAKEDLYVSPAKVRIHFEFVNDSAKDIDTIVAFPLPDIDSSVFTEEPLGTVTNDPVNFVGFTVNADGKRIVPQVEQRAIYKGRDVTAALAALHIPVNIVTYRNDLMLHLSPAQIKALHAADLTDSESGEGEHPHWTIRTKFWWKQKFPAGKTVVLDHAYQPVTGQTFYGVYDLSPANARDDGNRHWDTKFCIDPATHKSLAARIGAKAKDPNNSDGSMLAYTTDYILMSGNNWKGPIGHFHLVLDKQKPDNILSLCWDGTLKKTGATTFDFTQDDFAPPRDIHLLVLQDIPKGG